MSRARNNKTGGPGARRNRRRPTPLKVVKGQLKNLTGAVRDFLAAFDELMKGPSTFERGKKLGRLAGSLQWVNDHARMYGLNASIIGDKPVSPVSFLEVLRTPPTASTAVAGVSNAAPGTVEIISDDDPRSAIFNTCSKPVSAKAE